MLIKPVKPKFYEIIDFLLLTVSSKPEQVLAYQVSESLDRLLHQLLDKKSRESLSEEEQSDLDTLITFADIVTFSKAMALEQLDTIE
jgi:hypothetical protein